MAEFTIKSLGRSRMATALLAAAMSGCGCTYTALKLVPTAPSSITYKNEESVLNVPAYLSPYGRRIRSVPALPLVKADDASGHLVWISGTNILFIDPTLDYAIRQFHTIWPDLKSKPTVVWVHATPSRAAAVWQADGYATDPLPSANTLYSTSQIPSPDAYHANDGKWQEVPGVLKPNETRDWIKFFRQTSRK
ncbi:MAG: hypothetical protein K6T83_00185 [Alicyclobacillus sp.]|nr:hypothetical protein [Alicyclobacillus sp.]